MNLIKNTHILALLICFIANSLEASWHEVLQNNGFEQTSSTAWSAYSLAGGDPASAGIVNLGNAHSGTWYAYVGDYNASHYNALGVVRQIITIPANATSSILNFYLNVTSQETTSVNKYDTMGAYLRTYPGDVQVVTYHEWSNLDKDPNGIKTNYVQQNYTGDVSSYAGNQMILQFYAQTDSSFSTTFRIDDVSLQIYIPDYAIVVSCGSNGSVTPGGNNTIESGQLFSLTATPAVNYTVDQWYVNGTSVQTGGATFSFLVNASVNVSVTFKPIVYTVTVSAGANGTVSPSGSVSVNAGNDLTLTATPGANYSVSTWTVNGTVAQQGSTSFILRNVQSSEPVSVSFTPTLYKLDVTQFGSGSFTISPPGGSYATGTPITLSATPQSGYQFSEWRGAQYGRNTSLSFAKGGADESLELHFVQVFQPPTLDTSTAHSTPSGVSLNVPTTASWVTCCEWTTDFHLWNLGQVILGQNPTTSIQHPNTGGNEYMRTSSSPQVTTPAFLSFPIHNGDTPQSAPVTAIMDHHRTHPEISRSYDKDSAIRTAQGATYAVRPQDEIQGKYFAILPIGVSASTLFTYTGVQVAGQAGPGYLQYDGHPAYDYAYGFSTDVYAAASGIVMTDDDLLGSNLAGSGMISYYMQTYHALVINHSQQGYCTIYMHLSSIDSSYVDTSDPNTWKPVKASVANGAHIGKTGNFDLASPIPYHFHFEVWRLDNGNAWNYADPYGTSGPDGANGTQSITPNLWK